MVTIEELRVADPPAAWAAAGFAVDGDVCRVGTVRIRLVGRDAGTGILGWTLGVVGPGAPPPHPNGATVIDHVVLLSPDLDRTARDLAALGLEPRRERDGRFGGEPVRQVFYRLGEVILEVVGSPGRAAPGPDTFWGLTCTVADIDATAAFLGDRIGRVKDAVQPGRRITTLRHQAVGMSVPTAFISPATVKGPSSRPEGPLQGR